MKDTFRNGLFGLLVILLVGIVCIQENPSDSVQDDLSDQITTEQAVDLVSIDYAFELSEIPNHAEQTFYTTASISVESPPDLNIQLSEDFSDHSEPLQFVGLRDETLSMDYFREYGHFVPLYRSAAYFT